MKSLRDDAILRKKHRTQQTSDFQYSGFGIQFAYQTTVLNNNNLTTAISEYVCQSNIKLPMKDVWWKKEISKKFPPEISRLKIMGQSLVGPYH
ncbi:hypothetical protein Bhyg_13821 [Pseudolycoriella hygida]|uniref:Uncharacterized protein n=1 Tax=Pseudolycoriella hygida TaxID=35572 RepID=A0A9Q0MP21_9DIPT|nr:hypothetical protein Bhyg_13821 [Pseudolycoriella hygida]